MPDWRQAASKPSGGTGGRGRDGKVGTYEYRGSGGGPPAPMSPAEATRPSDSGSAPPHAPQATTALRTTIMKDGVIGSPTPTVTLPHGLPRRPSSTAPDHARGTSTQTLSPSFMTSTALVAPATATPSPAVASLDTPAADALMFVHLSASVIRCRKTGTSSNAVVRVVPHAALPAYLAEHTKSYHHYHPSSVALSHTSPT